MAKFQQQTEVLKTILESIENPNSGIRHQLSRCESVTNLDIASHDSMTTLSNCFCLTFQLFIFSAFVGKAPLSYLFPNKEKESEIFKVCAEFFKCCSDNTSLSLDQEKVTIHEFLNGDTIYGKRGVIAWKHKGRIATSGSKRDVYPLIYRVKRLRSRLHDEMTRTALKCFFPHIPNFRSLRLGVNYSCIISTSRQNALRYCMDQMNLGTDPLTNGTWKETYTRTNSTLMDHAKDKMKRIYNKLEAYLSTNQLTEISSYFKKYYFDRYGRYASLFNLEIKPIIPAVLEAYIATKVRCRLADIGTYEAKKRAVSHEPFFEVSHCESHFIPLLGDLIKITQRQGTTELSLTNRLWMYM